MRATIGNLLQLSRILSVSLFQPKSATTLERNKMYEHRVLTHFYQQHIEPINEAGDRLGIPRSEFIRQACRTLINTMKEAASRCLSSPNVNVEESDCEPINLHSSSGGGF